MITTPTTRRLLTAAIVALLNLGSLRAADATGQWRGEVETPMGLLKLQLTFQADGAGLSGKVASDFGGDKREAPLQDVKLAGDTLTFSETIDMQGNTLRIDYTGHVGPKEITFTRHVGDFGTDEFVATRMAAPAAAAGIDGKWTVEFDTQVGKQTYRYDLRASGETLTGKAEWERMGEKGVTDLKDGKIAGNAVSFVEPMSAQGMDLLITYAGKLDGDTLKLTRTVGEFATEEGVATRLRAGASPSTPPAAAPATPSPAPDTAAHAATAPGLQTPPASK